MQCPKCSRQFTTQGALNGHQRSHSFHTFQAKLPNQAERRAQRDKLNAEIVVAAIGHYTRNCQIRQLSRQTEPHCDICAVVSKVDGLILQDLSVWLEKENESKRS